MTKFTVIGHVYKVRFYEKHDDVFIKTQNGTVKIVFDKNVGAVIALRNLVDEKGNFISDMTSQLYIVHGEIMGEWENPWFSGRFIRLV